jgi:UDP-glucuronate 4-epimerase
MAKYLVTGSAGFIGFHTAKYLLEQKIDVVGVDNFNSYYDVSLKEDRNTILEKHNNFKLYRGNFEDIDFVRRIFKENKIDKVCHLGAQAGVRYSLTNPHVYIQSNLVGFANLIDEAKNNNVKTFVYASSSSVYGSNKKIPFSVEDRVDSPMSLYAATKKANEAIAYSYHHLFGLNCTGLRFFTVYGPYGRPDLSLFKFVKAILEDKAIDVYNYGKMKRDFTYIDDIVFGIASSLEKSYPYEIFNLGNNKSVELEYFIELVEKELGKKAEKNMLPMQPGDVLETWADIKHSVEMLGYNPKISVEEGVKNFIKWYRDYYQV